MAIKVSALSALYFTFRRKRMKLTVDIEPFYELACDGHATIKLRIQVVSESGAMGIAATLAAGVLDPINLILALPFTFGH